MEDLFNNEINFMSINDTDEKWKACNAFKNW